MDGTPRKEKCVNGLSVWFQKRKVMLHLFVVFLFKSNRYSTGKRWLGRQCLPRPEKKHLTRYHTKGYYGRLRTLEE